MPKAHLLNQYLKSLQVKGFEQFIRNITFVTAEKGNCTATVKLTEEDLTSNGRLHTGYCSTIIDSISGYALLTHEEWMLPSVSVNINLTFLSSAKVGDEIKLTSKVLKAGRSMAYLDVELRNANTNELLVKAEHTKFKSLTNVTLN